MRTLGEKGLGLAPAETAAPLDQPQFSGNTAIRGGVWAMFGFGFAQVIRFVSSLVMTRLLLPDSWGLMAFVWSVLQGLHLFSDLGIGTNIVQNARGADPVFRHTAWTIQVLRGMLIWGVAIAIAPLVEALYPEYTGVAPLIQVIAASAFLAGLGSMSLDILSRNMAVARLSLLELGNQLLSTATMVIWAVYDPTPWAMVAGALVSATVRTVASHVLFGGDRLGWDRASAAAILAFGKWVFVSTVLTFLVGQADRLIFATMIPKGVLGVYSVGVQLAMLAPDLVARLGASVAFPVYCRTVQLGEPLEPVFVRYRRPIVLLGGCGLAGLCGAGDAVIEFLYLAESSSAGWILQWLAAGAWFGQILEGTRGSGLIALGHPRLISLTCLAKLVGMVTLIPVGFHVAGFPGAVVGFVVSDVIKYAAAAWSSARMGLGALGGDARLTVWFGATALAAHGTVRVLRASGCAPWLQTGAALGVVAALWLPLLWPLCREVRTMLARRA